MPDNKVKKEKSSVSIKLEGQTADHFAAIKKDLQERVPSMSDPDNAAVARHGMYLAAESLKAGG